MGTGISEASKRVPIFPFDTQGGKQVSSYFDRGTGSMTHNSHLPARVGGDSIQYRAGKTHCQGHQEEEMGAEAEEDACKGGGGGGGGGGRFIQS